MIKKKETSLCFERIGMSLLFIAILLYQFCAGANSIVSVISAVPSEFA